MDLWPVDIRRFAKVQNSIRTLRERSPETLSLHYAVSFPGRQYKTARNLRLSPLHSRLEKAGAVFFCTDGMGKTTVVQSRRNINTSRTKF